MNNNESFSLKSEAQYRDIKSVEFTPLTKIEITKKYSKGDWKFWKWLGFIPLIPYKVKEDLYKAERIDIEGIHSLEYFSIKSWLPLYNDENHLYKMAKVYITRIAGNSTVEYFLRNEAAIAYIDKIKTKCKESGNELK